MFFSSVQTLGLKLSQNEISLICRVLDPFDNDYLDMKKLVDVQEIRKYKQDNLPELKPREEQQLLTLVEELWIWYKKPLFPSLNYYNNNI